MNLNDQQKATVLGWINEGLKLSDIQKKLETDLGMKMTYMEVRFLLDDLRLTPKDPTPPPAPPVPPAPPQAPPATAEETEVVDEETEAVPAASSVSVSVDQIAQPGAIVSGKVTFSDGQSGTWVLDEMGRLGLGMKQKGYRPPAADVEVFQKKLQQELAKMGF